MEKGSHAAKFEKGDLQPESEVSFQSIANSPESSLTPADLAAETARIEKHKKLVEDAKAEDARRVEETRANLGHLFKDVAPVKPSERNERAKPVDTPNMDSKKAA